MSLFLETILVVFFVLLSTESDLQLSEPNLPIDLFPRGPFVEAQVP